MGKGGLGHVEGLQQMAGADIRPGRYHAHDLQPTLVAQGLGNAAMLSAEQVLGAGTWESS